ncbi:3-keto-5-aminohexanoate cleavage protein [Geodermatophilus sp. YIM 151500]|uniref:3-keto-5-aminohexanoate cleavage protein n=1 Tax=Geodermatophilus sp. YIM 151500 TaxID=2984531 RepID=UPI0021E4011E|nr:3-keto-5-aminohexanoate cleavage protein [Geodermatophilus sp. YIM 151500]MCV2489364.1 3-keto-5-aminohexanoate cleavage protein [Geodermatophilus sp. YIM 151500]
MLLKACLNGARRPGRHPALPVTPAALADDTVRTVAAGAGAVHLHPKDADGADTLDAGAVSAVLGTVRAAAPGVPVGVTTGAWAAPDPADRLAAVRSWTDLPDFASVNWHEDGADDIAAALLDRGVGVEAGLWHAEAVDAWLASPHRDRCLRVLLELPHELDADDVVTEADRLRDRLPGGVPVLLHGQDGSCWPALRYAARLGLDTRIGLEDTLVLPDGSQAPDNAALVAAARSLLDFDLQPTDG